MELTVEKISIPILEDLEFELEVPCLSSEKRIKMKRRKEKKEEERFKISEVDLEKRELTDCELKLWYSLERSLLLILLTNTILAIDNIEIYNISNPKEGSGTNEIALSRDLIIKSVIALPKVVLEELMD
ncbi:hypothetical protein H8356DRAFT_1335968 [Neocallimastix lanati (nom. inval.)]|nr:hypothetical protein H8356DRAFT_1335968 [Neocallimastix sp. JGI-2020a]